MITCIDLEIKLCYGLRFGMKGIHVIILVLMDSHFVIIVLWWEATLLLLLCGGKPLSYCFVLWREATLSFCLRSIQVIINSSVVHDRGHGYSNSFIPAGGVHLYPQEIISF